MDKIIYTGYYALYDYYIKYGLTPIAISGKAPDWFNGIQWKFFAPSWDIFSKWKTGIITDEQYTNRFLVERLGKLDINQIKQQINMINNPILLCYEKHGFCHRHIVADWLNANDITCEEYIII